MGKAMCHMRFEGSSPSPEAIAQKISQICGQSVEYKASESSEFNRFKGVLFFTEFPEETIELRAPLRNRQIGPNEKPSGETLEEIVVDGYIMQEITLFMLTSLALERLGGQEETLSEKERDDGFYHDYDRPITSEELAKRFKTTRKRNRQLQPLFILYIIFLPIIMLPSLLWMLISAPYRLTRYLIARKRIHP